MEICLLLELSLFQQHYAISLQISSIISKVPQLSKRTNKTYRKVSQTHLSIQLRSMHIQATCTVINSRTLQIYTD